MEAKNWFDTEFYHILYKNRDNREAISFMDKLVGYLTLPKQSKILDLACGKGRHAIYLNKLGYHVTGVDSSDNSITYAKMFENETLQFLKHDMRKPLNLKFDAIFNLFTSFGYFHDDNENKTVLRNITSGLAKNGVGVIDFMNINYVIPNLIPHETKIVDGITFQIKRRTEGEMLLKSISFEYNGLHYEFFEHVKMLTLDRFEFFFEGCCSSIYHVFGDYNLNPFNHKTSERLILVFK